MVPTVSTQAVNAATPARVSKDPISAMERVRARIAEGCKESGGARQAGLAFSQIAIGSPADSGCDLLPQGTRSRRMEWERPTVAATKLRIRRARALATFAFSAAIFPIAGIATLVACGEQEAQASGYLVARFGSDHGTP